MSKVRCQRSAGGSRTVSLFDKTEMPHRLQGMIEQIRPYLIATPFEPFILQMADARTLLVNSPDGLWITPKSGMFYWHQADDTMERINLLLIVGVRGTANPVD